MNMKKIVLSTNNKNKVKELKYILKDLPFEIISKEDIGYGEFDVEEDGDTLEDNASKKAIELAEKIDFMVLADDSGLFVDALDGRPGVYSARYAGEDGNDKKNNEKLLSELRSIDEVNRGASFKTVIALVDEKKDIKLARGECKGKIISHPRGENGFGYDPLFIPDGYDMTFAELDDDIKNKISHRYKALNNLKEILMKMVEGEE